MAERSKTFEASMERLEAIVRQLEQGNVPLEESLKLFLEVVKLMKGPDGEPVEQEFVRDE